MVLLLIRKIQLAEQEQGVTADRESFRGAQELFHAQVLIHSGTRTGSLSPKHAPAISKGKHILPRVHWSEISFLERERLYGD